MWKTTQVMALVACAVQSEDQDKFVQRIMHLDGDSQRVLKDCIEMVRQRLNSRRVSNPTTVPRRVRDQCCSNDTAPARVTSHRLISSFVV